MRAQVANPSVLTLLFRLLSLSLSLSFQLPVDDVTNPSIAKAFTDMFRKVPTSKFDVFKGLTGHIPAGKMTLVLAPPGGGKSAFLKVRQASLHTNFASMHPNHSHVISTCLPVCAWMRVLYRRSRATCVTTNP